MMAWMFIMFEAYKISKLNCSKLNLRLLLTYFLEIPNKLNDEAFVWMSAKLQIIHPMYCHVLLHAPTVGVHHVKNTPQNAFN